MALSTNDILRIVVSLAFPDSVIAQNIFYVLFENDGTSADDQDVLDDLEDYIEACYGDLQGAMSSQTDISDGKVYVYDSSGGDFDEVGTILPAFTASGNADMSPHGVAALVHGYTTDPDVIARKYYGGIQDTSVTDSDISAGVLTNLLLAAADWVTPFTGSATGSGFVPGVWSPTQTAFFAFNDNIVVNGQVAYQRRRKPGVGI
jgi:hypothetical protein